MKRRLLTLGLLILAAAIINVAVAWGIVLAHGSSQEIAKANSQIISNSHRPMTIVEEQWYHAREEQGYLTPALSSMWPQVIRGTPRAADERGVGWHATVFIEEFRGPSGRKSMIRLPNGKQVQAEDTGELTLTTLSRCESGWPTKALFIVFGQSSSAPPLARPDSGWALPGCWGLFPKLNEYVVPVDPLLLPFAINTIFYAAIVWLLCFAPFNLRRWRRIKRGLCQACAYPVGTNELCTECGKPVNVRAG